MLAGNLKFNCSISYSGGSLRSAWSVAIETAALRPVDGVPAPPGVTVTDVLSVAQSALSVTVGTVEAAAAAAVVAVTRAVPLAAVATVLALEEAVAAVLALEEAVAEAASCGSLVAEARPF